jgi:hypothetical protein
MLTTLASLIDRLDSDAISGTGVIRWGCPVPSFGDLAKSRVATLGLNPSSREFMDERGNELQGVSRRFHTLTSLGLRSWSDVDARHLRQILESCRAYFLGNPYSSWFKRLDRVVTAARASYYDSSRSACHIDLIPYATARRWTELTSHQRTSLLTVAGDTLGLLLRDSAVEVLILNGNTVVERFQDIASVRLKKEKMSAWTLPRRSTPSVAGYSYWGIVDTLSGVSLSRHVLVLGFNHNLQSSFGVTTEVVLAIRAWIARAAKSMRR